ncbi:MAG: tetratricopeptide repeat protein [Promethearchaeia archaeon]
MVATIQNPYFKKSKTAFENGDLSNSLNFFEKSISEIDKSEDPSKYINFLKELLQYCEGHNLVEVQAVVLRFLGRVKLQFGKYVDSLDFHRKSLKIQRKLGKKLEIANQLLFLGEDLELLERYEESIKSLKSAAEIFKELGKHKKTEEIQNEIERIKDFSKKMLEDEYLLNKFIHS